jgi:polyhydroxybutyrate depolymerase
MRPIAVMLTGTLLLTPGGSAPGTAHGSAPRLRLPSSALSKIESPWTTGTHVACSSDPRAGDTRGSLVSDGVRRTYLLHVPRHLAAGRHLPLVLVFHGLGGDATQRAGYWSRVADRYGFVVVAPNGTGTPRSWDIASHVEKIAPSGAPSLSKLDDVRFTARLIDALRTRLCIDPRRVYAAGFSLGGGMAYRLACDLSRRIAAIAPVSGVYIYTACHPTRPVSVIAFHGDSDPTVPYYGDKRHGLPDIRAWARAWARRDGCAHGPTPFLRSKEVLRYAVVGVRYTACRAASDVELYTIHGGGHEVPLPIGRIGHASLPEEIIWRFFAAHPIR